MLKTNDQLDPFHESILVQEILDLLKWTEPVGCLWDGTVGGGGHLRALLAQNPRPQRIVASDQDPESLARAKSTLNSYEPIDWIQENFREVGKKLMGSVDRMILDLGVSSHQLDAAERGFSFQKDGPLDMRMSPLNPVTAADWLLSCEQKELETVLRDYGEDPYARKVAERWFEVRRDFARGQPLTTKSFVEALGFQMDSKTRFGKHPLTRVFQALRMKINDEEGALAEILEDLPKILAPKGRVAILTFHSLEDRQVKWALRGRLKPINKKVIMASAEEQKRNPRSRSAKLRVYESESA